MEKLWLTISSLFMGLRQLLRDPAGTICLIILFITACLCWYKRIGDVSFAAVAAAVPAVIAMCKHDSFNGSDIDKHSNQNT